MFNLLPRIDPSKLKIRPVHGSTQAYLTAVHHCITEHGMSKETTPAYVLNSFGTFYVRGRTWVVPPFSFGGLTSPEPIECTEPCFWLIEHLPDYPDCSWWVNLWNKANDTMKANNCERCDGTGWDFKNTPIPPFPKCPCDTRAAIWHICEGLAKAGAANG